MRYLSSLIVALFATFSTSAMSAETSELCNAVLQPGVFNVGETSTAESFASSFHDVMCRTKWSSRSDLENRASSWGLDLTTTYGILGIDSSGADNSDIRDQAYDHFCHRTAQDIAYSTGFFNKYRNSDFAVGQWRQCVEATAEGHFAIAVPDVSLDGALVRLARRAQGQVPDLVVYSVEKSAGYDVSCTFNGVDVTKAKFPANQREIEITCAKRADVPVSFAINTNWGTFDPISIPGYSKSISSLQSDLEALRQQIEAQNASQQKALDLLSQSVVHQARVCLHVVSDDDPGQCEGARDTCSEWTSVGPSTNWTKQYRDNTDGRNGGCLMQWRIEMR